MLRSQSRDIVLVTCRAWPTLSAGDAELARELEALGHRVRHHPWNDASLADFTSADLVVLRSNWDYHHELKGFERWLGQVDRSGAVLHNPAELVRSHMDKSYLADLQAAGFRTPRTMISTDFDVDAVMGWVAGHHLDRVVLKPAWGASGHGVELVRSGDIASAAERWRRDPDRRPMLIQEFVPEVADGEFALVFFAGEFSHALLRQPAPGDFRSTVATGARFRCWPTSAPA